MPSLLPKSTVTVRPRMAVEVRVSSVVAARADDGVGLVAQVAQAELPGGALVPGLGAGNVLDAAGVAAAVRRALGQVALAKGGDVTLIVPDAAVRVLLLDFDELPSKRDDALAVLRFRLSKLLPIPVETAQVSYQVMGRRDGAMQVLVVAMPKDVLAEYESAVRDAGYEPGAVLPSSLAVAAALEDAGGTATLLVNGSAGSLTTAIVRRGDLLLHRTIDLREGMHGVPSAAEESADLVESGAALTVRTMLTDREVAAELLQSISVASAYYEDTLGAAPAEILVAGEFAADTLTAALSPLGLAAKDVVQPADLHSTATAHVPHSLLAGVRGALKI